MGGGIFSTQLDGHTFSIMLAVLLAFTMVWEEITERLEHGVHDLPHYMSILEKIYRELTMLGFVSLFIVLGKEFWHLNDQIWSIPFEFAHLLSFLVAILYTLVAIVSIRRLQYTKNRWNEIAKMKVNDICLLLQHSIDEEDRMFGEGAEAKHASWPWRKLWSTLLPLPANHWEDVEWHLLRALFLREFKMGLEFDYSKYMRTKLLETLTMNLDIGGATWSLLCLTMCVFVGVDVMVNGNHLGTDDPRLPGPESILVPAVFGWVMFGIQVCVLVVLKKKIHHLLELYGCAGAAGIPKFLQRINAHIEIRNQLRFLPIFKDAGSEFLDALTEVLDVQFHTPNSYLAKQGEMGDSMFFICKGLAKIVDEDLLAREDVEDELATLGVLRSGDYMGEMSVLLSEPRSKSIICIENSVVCALKAESMPALEEMYPAAVKYMRGCAMSRKNKTSWDDQSAIDDEHANEGASQAADDHDHSHASKSVFMVKAARSFKAKGPIMDHADKVWNPRVEGIVRTLIEFTLLFQCFYLSYFWLHLAGAVLGSDQMEFPAWLATLLILLPTIFTVFIVTPSITRYYCLLVHTLKKDNVAIAGVAHSVSQVIELRNMIKASLFRSGLQKSQDAGLPSDCTAAELAVFVFEVIDADESNTLEAEELRAGLPDFGVFLTKPEFKILLRFLDPTKAKVVTLDQWRDFMMASDEELGTHKYHHGEIMREIHRTIVQAIHQAQDVHGADMNALSQRMADQAAVSVMFEHVMENTLCVEDTDAVPFYALKSELRITGGMRDMCDADFEHLAQHLDTTVHDKVSQQMFLEFVVQGGGLSSDDTEEIRDPNSPRGLGHLTPRALHGHSKTAVNATVNTTFNTAKKMEKGLGKAVSATFEVMHDGTKMLIDTKRFLTTSSYRDAKMPVLKNTARKNVGAILTQTRGSKEMTGLLYRYAQGEKLTDEEQALVKTQLIDISKAIPALAIFSVPGGALLLPLLAKMLPFDLMPSAFAEANAEEEFDEVKSQLPTQDEATGSVTQKYQ